MERQAEVMYRDEITGNDPKQTQYTMALARGIGGAQAKSPAGILASADKPGGLQMSHDPE